MAAPPKADRILYEHVREEPDRFQCNPQNNRSERRAIIVDQALAPSEPNASNTAPILFFILCSGTSPRLTALIYSLSNDNINSLLMLSLLRL